MMHLKATEQKPPPEFRITQGNTYLFYIRMAAGSELVKLRGWMNFITNSPVNSPWQNPKRIIFKKVRCLSSLWEAELLTVFRLRKNRQ
jgi:hypothetical protein